MPLEANQPDSEVAFLAELDAELRQDALKRVESLAEGLHGSLVGSRDFFNTNPEFGVSFSEPTAADSQAPVDENSCMELVHNGRHITFMKNTPNNAFTTELIFYGDQDKSRLRIARLKHKAQDGKDFFANNTRDFGVPKPLMFVLMEVENTLAYFISQYQT